MKYIEYSGMSYQQASREAARLIERLGWFLSFDRLTELHAIMDGHLDDALMVGRFDISATDLRI